MGGGATGPAMCHRPASVHEHGPLHGQRDRLSDAVSLLQLLPLYLFPIILLLPPFLLFFASSSGKLLTPNPDVPRVCGHTCPLPCDACHSTASNMPQGPSASLLLMAGVVFTCSSADGFLGFLHGAV